MIVIAFPYRDQILPYIRRLLENQSNYIWAHDLAESTEMLNRANEPVKTVYAYPGFKNVVEFLEGSRFAKAEKFWLIQPGEQLVVPFISGKDIQWIDTGLNSDS